MFPNFSSRTTPSNYANFFHILVTFLYIIEIKYIDFARFRKNNESKCIYLLFHSPKAGDFLNKLDFYSLTVELIIGFFAVLVVTNVLGKTQISQFTPFHFISALVLGELLGNAIYDREVSIKYVLYALFLWGGLLFLIEILTQKFKKTRNFFQGNPSILIRQGKIDYQELKKNRMDLNELLSLMRQKDIFSVREVEYAVLELSGSLSILKKSNYDQPDRQDLQIPEKPVFLPIALIMDREIIEDNLTNYGLDNQWLMDQLHMHGIRDVKDVLYAEWERNEGLLVIPFESGTDVKQ
ncbi:MAG: DUF421 domain-containing protein [Geosporobacter ferrireducens]|nr:DUF421 domain-containing protein [Geosporobacter ferrireducens]